MRDYSVLAEGEAAMQCELSQGEGSIPGGCDPIDERAHIARPDKKGGHERWALGGHFHAPNLQVEPPRYAGLRRNCHGELEKHFIIAL